MGRPKRKRTTDRVNYKIDSSLRALLASIAEREGRSEGSQVEQLILFYAAFEILNYEGAPLTFDAIKTKTLTLWKMFESDPTNDLT